MGTAPGVPKDQSYRTLGFSGLTGVGFGASGLWVQSLGFRISGLRYTAFIDVRALGDVLSDSGCRFSGWRLSFQDQDLVSSDQGLGVFWFRIQALGGTCLSIYRSIEDRKTLTPFYGM